MEQKELQNRIVDLIGLAIGRANDTDEQIEEADDRINAHLQKTYPMRESQDN